MWSSPWGQGQSALCPESSLMVDPAGRGALKGILRSDEPMHGHVSWRAGGCVERAYFPTDLDDLANFFAQTRFDETLVVVGLGSNLLVRDGGFHGTAVFTYGALDTLRREDDGTIYCETGVASPKLARFALAEGLAGAEFLAGIPGTFGGALAMNAGCHGGETWNLVERVLMLNRRGERIVRTRSDFAVGYRHVGLTAATDEIFAAAWLHLPVGDVDAARARMREQLDRRAATQPLALPNAGSVFRNPPGDHAARLIEAAGLKGLSEGGAQVSEKHANFIVNPEGKASASEIETLIGRVKAEVLEKFGISLRSEVRIIGERP
jgi:UDP-N-acetylmuramate dehydrogenase